MGMLYLIGLGLNNERDITLRAQQVAQKCECFVELYTSKWLGSLRGLENVLGKPVKQLKRPSLEENMGDIIKLAKQKDVAIFFPGDPLAATTHIELMMECRRNRIPVQVIHNASVFSAIGVLGLQLYKYGRTATIPFSGKLQSVRDALKLNKKAGLHTLLLLDVDADVGLYMSPEAAVRMLLKAKLAKPGEKLLAAAMLGTEEPEIRYERASDLARMAIGTPGILVVPGKMHFKEKEYLRQFEGLP